MLNRNNFLRWSGSLDSMAFANIAANKSVVMPTGADYLDVDVLTGSTATFGIDPNSIFATQELDGIKPRWNPATQRLRIFRPEEGVPDSVVNWGFRDWKGNSSNLGTISVDLTVLPLGWRVHPPSQYCMVGAYNQNTGYKAYSLLEQFYTSTGTVFSPLTTRPNIPTDSAYVAPVLDTTTCPLASIAPFIARNQSPSGNNIVITRILFSKVGQPNIIDLDNLTIAAGAAQTFNIPTGFYSSIQIYHSQGIPTGRNVQYSPGNTSTTNQTLTTSAATPNSFTGTSHVQPGSTILVY